MSGAAAADKPKKAKKIVAAEESEEVEVVAPKKSKKVAATDESAGENGDAVMNDEAPAVKAPKKRKVVEPVEEEEETVVEPAPAKKSKAAKVAEAEAEVVVKKSKSKAAEPEEAAEPKSSSKAAKANDKPQSAHHATQSSDTADQSGRVPLDEFPLSAPTRAALDARGFTHLFRIQAESFASIMAGSDLVGRAKTGTGKTLAFSLPVIEQMLAMKRPLVRGRHPLMLCLAPTRELVNQIGTEFASLQTTLSSTCIYGGSPYGPQEAAIRRGLDACIGTTGRVKDMINKGTLKLDAVKFVVLDEADEMLNMGFADDVEEILQSVPGIANRKKAASEEESESDKKDGVQVLLFSATLPVWIANVIKKYLRPDHVKIDLVGNQRNTSQASSSVRHIAIQCHWTERARVIGEVIGIYAGATGKTIVFCDSKKDANDLVVESSIKQDCQVLHGDIIQTQRETTLKAFRENKFQCLVATDVASRGLDINDVSLVVQSQPPKDWETYVHRSGRTGRAGATGISVTFYTPKDQYYLQNIERRTGVKFERLGVPQPSDIISSSVSVSTQRVKDVSPKVLSAFEAAAAELIEQMGPERAMASALAVICGHTQPLPSRSLLTSTLGQTTVMCKPKHGPIRQLSTVWLAIRKLLFKENADDRVKGMRLTENAMEAVFDVSEEDSQLIGEKGISDPVSGVQFTLLTTLPPMMERQSERPAQQTYWGKNTRSAPSSPRGGGRGGGYGGAAGGSGRGRGGGGSRGGGRGRW